MIFVRLPRPVVLYALTSTLVYLLLVIVLVGLGFLFRFMSRPGRRFPDIDYKILHKTGDKVNKVRTKPRNTMDHLKIKVIDICSDVEDLKIGGCHCTGFNWP